MDEKEMKELEERLRHTKVERNYHFHRPVGQFIEHVDTVNFSMDKDGEFHFENVGQVKGVKSQMPQAEVVKAEVQDDDDDDEVLAVVSKCFKFTSDYVKEKVATLVKEYCVSSADLALIEITLYYHGVLYKRNAHKAFVKALVAWRIQEATNDEELTAIVNRVKDKYSSLPKEGGYKGWEERFKNDKETCINIGQELGDTMPYKA